MIIMTITSSFDVPACETSEHYDGEEGRTSEQTWRFCLVYVAARFGPR